MDLAKLYAFQDDVEADPDYWFPDPLLRGALAPNNAWPNAVVYYDAATLAPRCSSTCLDDDAVRSKGNRSQAKPTQILFVCA